MKLTLKKVLNFIIPIYWGAQGAIWCSTGLKFYIVVGGMLILMSILKYLIKRHEYNIAYLVFSAFYFVASSVYLFLLFLMFSSYLSLLGILLNLLVIVYMIKCVKMNNAPS